MSAFYDDGTGLCFWCPQLAITDYMGLPLCDNHADEELAKDMVMAG